MSSGLPTPKTTRPRPALPASGNKLLRSGDSLPPVKFQPIKKDGSVVIVGRVKIPTPITPEQKTEHAYVLRRYDTGFISLSTMWKGAFPTAPSSAEKEEIQWVKANFDFIPPAGKKEDMRLAGTWVPIDVARFVAPSYNLSHVVTILMNASPDSETLVKANLPTPPDTVNGSAHKTSGPNKRARKEAPETPAKTPTGVNGAIAQLSTPASTRQKTKSPAPPPASRSTPTRSAKSRKAPSPAPATPGTASRRSTRTSMLPQHREENEEEEDAEDVKPPIPDPAEDIAESQSLVQRLMTQQNHAAAPVASAVKRTREEADAPLLLNLDQPSKEVIYIPPSERALVTNRRVLPQWPTLDSNQKSVAWGTLAFAIGWGAAATLLPQFF